MHRAPINYEKILLPSAILSEKFYSDDDVKETNVLYQTFLKDKYISDISDPNHIAKVALTNAKASLNTLLDHWTEKIVTLCGLPPDTSKKAKARLVPYGSHMLDVSTIDGDVDALVLAPKFVERDKHFFGELPSFLKEDPNISDIQTIRDAYVPLIKFKYQNLSIDLIFASLDTVSLDEKLDKLKDDNILMGMDAEMKRSVNGFRVAQKILESVSNVENFRTTLKLVKLWAKSKSIYSNSMGYLGGISWAILVAKICQLFPNFKPNKLLVNFFKFYSEWQWEIYHVQIAEIQYKTFMPDKQWTPEEKTTMMVLTPAFPCMNSTYNVSPSTLKIISQHIKEGWDIIYRCMSERKMIEWKKVFEKYDFFKKNYHFIEITICSDAETREQYIKWRSLVESKLRHFTKSFEFFEFNKQIDIRPYPIPFERDNESSKYSVSYYVAVKLNKEHESLAGRIDFAPIAKDFLDNLTSFRKKEDKLKIFSRKREELPDVVFEGKERPKWASKDWTDAKRATFSEKSENEEAPAQNIGLQNNIQMFPNMNHQVGMQQNTFQTFYPFPYHTGQFMQNQSNVQNSNYLPMNFIYPPQYGGFQGKNNYPPQPPNNNPSTATGNKKPTGETNTNHAGVGGNGVNDNASADNGSNSNSQSTRMSGEGY